MALHLHPAWTTVCRKLRLMGELYFGTLGHAQGRREREKSL